MLIVKSYNTTNYEAKNNEKLKQLI
jgi:hypothetical protein